MKISVYGAGYVGLVQASCLANLGHDVVCAELSVSRLAALAQGKTPFYEPGMDELLTGELASGRLRFTSDPAVAAAHGEVQFLAVGTPPLADGSSDLSYLLAAADTIGANAPDDALIVTKSTVPVGTGKKVAAQLRSAALKAGRSASFRVASNPEFLAEGRALPDFMEPQRTVFGVADAKAEAQLREVYAPLKLGNDRTLVMSVESAELAKYAANAMLAVRISFMNELANLADATGACIDSVREAMSLDERVGRKFLNSGCGYGGSCFPKDVTSLVKQGEMAGTVMRIADAASEINIRQRVAMADRIISLFQSRGKAPVGCVVALWGMAFKPDTDDVREAPAVLMAERLLQAGFAVRAYDPQASETGAAELAKYTNFSVASTAMEALADADVLLIATEWKEFGQVAPADVARFMRAPVVFDGRSVFNVAAARAAGLDYHAFGREHA
ncbi:UDP-glucose/GDP-mannose dehydrogenase family protein [Casimicrobium huifangae]|uniref:UDP-glucose dehydrogenase family protein n=1 Tax=Casimicrobium huifangae TaxID=2591109 RepID=UPI0012EBD874|nr:UDP-glucose/GDP-mannose dehydrogenase family protein [Casimicrobium huifangae]